MNGWRLHFNVAQASHASAACSMGPGARSSHCGGFVAVFAGELSNHLELRRGLRFAQWRSDSATETVVEGFAQRGAALLQDLRGSFVLACWEQQRARLLVAADRFGLTPLLWRQQGDGVEVVSSPALLAGAQTQQRQGPMTLPPGVLHWWQADGQQRSLRWWPSWPGSPWSPLPVAGRAKLRGLIRRELERVVAEQLVALTPANSTIVLLVDGGLCSQILRALIKQRCRGTLVCVAWPIAPAQASQAELASQWQVLTQQGHRLAMAALGGDALFDLGPLAPRSQIDHRLSAISTVDRAVPSGLPLAAQRTWTQLFDTALTTAISSSLEAARAAGLELRLPLLDPQFVELMLRLPAHGQRQRRRLLLESCADLITEDSR